MNEAMRSVSYGHNFDHVRLCVLKSKIWLLGWNIQIGINFYQSWSNVQIKFCDFNKFKNWLIVWNFQFIKTGHGFGRTKHFGVPQFGNFAWLVKIVPGSAGQQSLGTCYIISLIKEPFWKILSQLPCFVRPRSKFVTVTLLYAFAS